MKIFNNGVKLSVIALIVVLLRGFWIDPMFHIGFSGQSIDYSNAPIIGIILSVIFDIVALLLAVRAFIVCVKNIKEITKLQYSYDPSEISQRLSKKHRSIVGVIISVLAIMNLGILSGFISKLMILVTLIGCLGVYFMMVFLGGFGK